MAYGKDYQDERYGGPSGIRYPQEAGKSTFVVKKEVDLGIVSGTVKLSSDQAGSSFITANPSAALTLVLPVCQPGHETLVQNLSASYTITVEVSGNTSNTAVVPVSTLGLVVQTGLNLGVVLAAVASVAAYQSQLSVVTYTSAGAIAPSGTALLKTGTAGAMTLVIPPAGATLLIEAIDAEAYVVTTPLLAINGTNHIMTFAAAAGNFVQLSSSAGVWSVVSSVGVTLS